MSKKYVLTLGLIAVLFVSTGVAMAETTIQQIQSPIYTDDIGRSHFLGRGGYSSVRHIEMGEAQASAVNEVANENKRVDKEVMTSINNSQKSLDTDITSVIKERSDVPVSAKSKAKFTAEDRQMDPSASFGQGSTYLPTSGVNESKTIYTDDIGRLHFFGKGNLIK